MNDYARLVLAVWQATSDYVPMNLRDDAAEALVRAFMNSEEIEVKELYDLSGDCVHLDAALETIGEEEAHEAEEDDYEEGL